MRQMAGFVAIASDAHAASGGADFSIGVWARLENLRCEFSDREQGTLDVSLSKMTDHSARVGARDRS